MLKQPSKWLEYLWSVKRISFDALSHFNDDDGWAMASHVAMSTLFAVFPFLIFLTTLASFLGAGAYAQNAVDFIFNVLPQDIAKPISNEVHTVLSTPRGDLLTLSALLALYFSSNGVEALRVALNRAYRVRESRNFLYRRLQSLFFVLGAAGILIITSLLLVVIPLAVNWIDAYLPWVADLVEKLVFWKNIILSVVLVLGLFAAHRWLPVCNHGFLASLPGIILTLIAWAIGAWALGLYLAQFANYVSTYAGLASGIVALLFLYLIAVIFILGAELNAAVFNEREKF